MTFVVDAFSAFGAPGTGQIPFGVESVSPMTAPAGVDTEFTIRGRGFLGVWRVGDAFLGRLITVIDDDELRISVAPPNWVFAGGVFTIDLVRTNGPDNGVFSTPPITVI